MEGFIVAYAIDRATVLSIIELADAITAAEARRAASYVGPQPCVLTLYDEDTLPAPLTPEERLLHDRLAELDDHDMARVLALFWLGRHASWEPVDEEFFPVLLAQAIEGLDNTPWYLTMKPQLGKALRTAMAIVDV
jgi:hypothetical protein